MEVTMASEATISRRAALAAPSAMLLASAAAACAAEEQTSARSASRALVAVFTRTGNTRVIAGQLQRALGAELFEIQPALPYPEDYEQTVEQARRERDAGFEPALKTTIPTIAAYDTLFLGFPVWGETSPPIIRAFLSAHDLAGKVIRPFITHGGYGLGRSLSVLRSHAPRAQLLEAFSMEADQERRTLNQVTDWLRVIERS
jgi:flavodoxin